MEYLINSAIGAAGGWIMGQLGKGGNFGAIGNVVAGVVGGNAGGALLGTALTGLLHTSTDASTGGIGTWLASGLGSVVLTWLSGFIKNDSKA